MSYIKKNHFKNKILLRNTKNRQKIYLRAVYIKLCNFLLQIFNLL